MTPRERYIAGLKEALGAIDGELTVKVAEFIEHLADSYELGYVEGQADLTEKLVTAKAMLDANG